MNKLATLVAVAVISGCAGDNTPTEYSYTAEQDGDNATYDAATNLTLLPSNGMYISFERVAQLYSEMQTCMGLSIDPTKDKTIIMWRSFENSDEWFTRDTGGAIPSLGAGWGFAWNAGNDLVYVFINTDLDKHPYTTQGFYRDAGTDTQVVKHEFLHAIDYHTGVDIPHGEEFTRCDAQVTLAN